MVLLSLSNTVQNAIIGNDNSLTGGLIGAFTLLAMNYAVIRFLFRHRRLDQLDDNAQALSGAYFQEDRSPRWHVKDTDYGFIAASQRNVDDNKSYWRLNQFLLPFYTMITPPP